VMPALVLTLLALLATTERLNRQADLNGRA
jgi:hypothetical protein